MENSTRERLKLMPPSQGMLPLIKRITGSTLAVLLLAFSASLHAFNQFASEELQDRGCFIPGASCVEDPIPPEPGEYVKDEIILSILKGFPPEKAAEVIKHFNLSEMEAFEMEGFGFVKQLKTNGKDPVLLKKQIEKLHREMKAALNSKYRFNAIRTSSSQLKTIRGTYPKSLTGATQALEYARGEGVLIGMIDGPVDVNHRDLKGKVIQKSFINYNPNSASAMHHGSMIAGVLVGENERIGIAPKAKLLAINAFTFGENGRGDATSDTMQLVKAIDFAIRSKVDILNLSFSGSNEDPLVKKMLKKAVDNGILVVSSCGNNKSDEPYYPAAFPGVLAVTAVDHLSKQFPEANRGKYIDVAAPGVGILTTAPGGRYDFATGTSVAAAHVSGALALLLSKNKKSKSELFITTAKDLGKPGYDTSYGNGLINVLNAIQKLN